VSVLNVSSAIFLTECGQEQGANEDGLTTDSRQCYQSIPAARTPAAASHLHVAAVFE